MAGHGLAWVWPVIEYTIVASLVQWSVLTVIALIPLRRLRKRVDAVIDSLDPSKPIGVTEQLNELEDEIRLLRDAI